MRSNTLPTTSERLARAYERTAPVAAAEPVHMAARVSGSAAAQPAPRTGQAHLGDIRRPLRARLAWGRPPDRHRARTPMGRRLACHRPTSRGQCWMSSPLHVLLSGGAVRRGRLVAAL